MRSANSLKLGEAFENHHHSKTLMSPGLHMQDHSINHSHRQEQTAVFQQDLLRVVGQFGRCVAVAAAGYIGVNVQMWFSPHPITAVHPSHPSGNPVCSSTWPAPGISVSPGTLLCQG